MKTLDEVRGACRIDENGCWIWTGAMQTNMPKMLAPDWTTAEGAMRVQLGRRAVWHILHGNPIPAGHRVFGTCRDVRCLNPKCIDCGPPSKWRKVRSIVAKRHVISQQLNGRKGGRARTVLTAEMIDEIQQSRETGRALARRMHISEQTVSKARRGQIVCFQPIGGFGAGLGSRESVSPRGAREGAGA